MKFSCPSCDGHIDAGPDWAGQTTECPHCGEAITIPEEVANERAAAPPAGSSGLAVGSLVCGILGVFGGITAIPAIIMGHIARGRARRDPHSSGEGLALAGLILGYLGLVFFAITVLAILASISVPVYNTINERAKITKIISNAKQVVLGLRTYAIDHDGEFPETLGELVPDYIPIPEILQYARIDGGETENFMYFPGFNESSPGDEIVVASGELVRGKRVIAMVDGSAKAISEGEYQQRTAGRSP